MLSVYWEATYRGTASIRTVIQNSNFSRFLNAESENDNKVIKLGDAIQEETEEESLDTPVETGNSDKSENEYGPIKAKSTIDIIENENETKIHEEFSV